MESKKWRQIQDVDQCMVDGGLLFGGGAYYNVLILTSPLPAAEFYRFEQVGRSDLCYPIFCLSSDRFRCDQLNLCLAVFELWS